jgi:hypothetical protein
MLISSVVFAVVAAFYKGKIYTQDDVTDKEVAEEVQP